MILHGGMVNHMCCNNIIYIKNKKNKKKYSNNVKTLCNLSDVDSYIDEDFRM